LGHEDEPEISFTFQVAEDVMIIEVVFTSLKSILTELGGYYSAIFHFSLFLASPFLYWHLNRSIKNEIGENDS
jgi:hypothetical protein